MKQVIAALALCCSLSLGGCADFRNAVSAAAGYTVTQSQVDTARTSYDAVVLAPAANYARLPICAKSQVSTFSNPCQSRAVRASLMAADQKVKALFDKVQAQIDSGNNSGVMAAWSDLQSAISTAQGVIAAFNIQ